MGGGWLRDARGAGGMGRLGDLRKSREGGVAWRLEGVGKDGMARRRDMAGSEAERDSQEVSEVSFPSCKG